MRGFTIAAACALAVAAAQPAIAREGGDSANTLTHGMVQMNLKVGQTSQAQILEVFGAPNITTMDASGGEMWVYDRHATVTRDSSGGFSIGLGLLGGGGDVAGGGGLGFGKRKSKSETSTRTMTLIIKFDANNVVSDFKSRSSSF